MANLLGGQNLCVEYPDKVLLDHVTLGVSAGDRLGIVGRNGDGKSTLLRVLFGVISPDAGLVTRRGGLRLALLGQDDMLSGADTVERLLLGSRPVHEVLAEARARDVLDGLCSGIAWESRIEELSGGQRRRLALAKLLLGEWDVIGLDEPTNHLDLEAVTWLARHLRHRWATNNGALLVVTHDRWFLDAVSQDTWEVHDGIVEPFEGGYAAYILARVERDRQAALAAEKRANLLRKELAWLRRGAPARSSKPKFRVEAATALIADVPRPRDTVELVKLATQRLGKTVIDLVDVDFSYQGEDGTPVLQGVTWRIAPGERAGILGANGAGKSTLLGLIAGELVPTRGRRREGKTVQLGVLDQEFRALKDISGYRVYELLGKLKGNFEIDGKELTPSQMLERLGFNTSQLQAKIEVLSGGQKRRLQILLLLLEEPNVLILDEPTNDIDTDTLTALEDVLDVWPGTLLVVSHDRYLLERITDTQYAVIGHHLRHLPRGIEEYLELQDDSRKTGMAPHESAPNTTKSPNTTYTSPGLSAPQAASKAAPPSGANNYQKQKQLAALERKIEKSLARQRDIETEMSQSDPADYAHLAALAKNLETEKTTQAGLEEEWLELAE